MEVTVRCAECGADLEEFKVDMPYHGDACIHVVPCECVKEG